MNVERWLPPIVGGIAVSTALSVVGVYAFGRSLPAHHEVTVRAVVPADPAVVHALVSDPARRTKWMPRVARIGQVADDALGRPVWRQLDPADDRFEFAVVSAAYPSFVVSAARPEEIGMSVTWSWTVSPAPGGSEIALTESAEIPNELFRGVWGLRYGPYAQVERDLAALAAHLGGAGPVTR